jgi:hypothetical protein
VVSEVRRIVDSFNGIREMLSGTNEKMRVGEKNAYILIKKDKTVGYL